MNKKIKVTYIVSDIDKAVAFEWIASYLSKVKFELSFILLNPGISKLEKFLVAEGVPVLTITCKSKKDWPSAYWQLLKKLKIERPDVVHCHLLTASILGLSTSWLLRIKNRIYTRHHSDFHFRYFPNGVKWDKLCNYFSTKIIAPSNEVVQILESRELVKKSKITLIHHGFDLDYFQKVPLDIVRKLQKQYNSENMFPVVGVISRFTELKGIQFIIPAFEKFRSNYPNALLLLFNANGDYRNRIEEHLEVLPQESYQLIPFEPEIAAAYRLFDIFIQASIDKSIESFGQTYIESLASEVPSIFTMAGIANEFIVDQENAVVVPFKDSEAIYKAMIRLMEDQQLRKTLKVNGLKSVKRIFDIHNMISKLENIYI